VWVLGMPPLAKSFGALKTPGIRQLNGFLAFYEVRTLKRWSVLAL